MAAGSWIDGLAGRQWSMLRELNLVSCPNLQSLPDGIWSSMGKLERVNLEFCYSLQSLPAGIEKLTSLRYLNLEGCRGLRSLPSEMEKLISLSYLNVRWGTPKPAQSVVESLTAQGCQIVGLSGILDCPL